MKPSARTVRLLIAAIAPPLCAIIAATAWLGSSNGLDWVARTAVQAGHGALTLENPEGSLLGEVRIRRLRFDGGDFSLEAESVRLGWQPAFLLLGELRLDRFAAKVLRYESRSTTAVKLPESLALPVPISIAALEVGHLEVSGLPVIDNLRVRYSGGAVSHEISLLQTQSAGWSVEGGMRIGARRPFPVEGRLEARHGETAHGLKASAAANGDLEQLAVAARGGGRGMSFQANATVQPFTPQPLRAFTALASHFDLSAWDRTLPATRFSAEASVRTENERLSGTLRAENTASGTLDNGRLPLNAVSLRFTGHGDEWTLHALELNLPGNGRISGQAAWRKGRGRTEVQLNRIDPSRIDSRMRAGTVTGTATIIGDPKNQQVISRLGGSGLQLQLQARHAAGRLTLDHARLLAGTGAAEIGGQLDIAAPRAFALRGRLSKLDLSRIAALPATLLNGQLSAEGRLLPDWESRVDLRLDNSRLRKLPFNASARFSTARSQWFDGSVQAAAGSNRLDVRGRYGRPRDQLSWSIAAEDLRALDPGLGGRLTGHGTITGSSEGPALDFTLNGRQLAAGRHQAGRIDAQGALGSGRDAPMRFTLAASGLRIAETPVDTLDLNANGTRARHSIDGSARGPDLSSRLRASGGVTPQGRWTGTVDQLEIVGPWPARLLAPAAVTAGPGLLIVEQLRAQLLDGELGPASLRAEQGRIETRGHFRGIAAGRLLPRNSGLTDNGLRAGGQWSLKLDEVWNGKAGIQFEGGDLSVSGEPRIPLLLRKATLNLTAADSLIDATLAIDSSAMGTAGAQVQTRLLRRDQGWLLPGEAPLTGNASLDFKSLAWLRALLPGLDRIDGQLALRMQAGGTIADPRLAGTITGDQIMLRAVGPGVDLRDGRLRAVLDGTRFRLEEFELRAGKGRIVASGSSELAGGLRSLDLQARAEHAQILLAPQWSAVIDGSGRLGLRDRRISIEGKFGLDEGRYDPGTRRRPALDDDVIVRSSRNEAPAKGSALPVQLDISIDLNDRLAVRGNGLDALLGGSLRITSRGAGLSALGDVRTVRGHYSVFGQQLDIERGTVAFAGPLTDPGLDLRAMRKFQTVAVGVEVSGSLQRPSVRLVSEPDMSDTDRLGWLALGRDPSSGDRAQLAVIQAAVLSLAGSGGKPMQRQIAEGFGLDEIGFAGGESGTLGVVALGKKLTDQLSIRLEQTLGGTAGSLLRIDFMLSERWRLRGTAGAENAGDILFTLRFD